MQTRLYPAMEALQCLVEHMDRLEANASRPGTGKEPIGKQTVKQQGPIVCHKCGQDHFAR